MILLGYLKSEHVQLIKRGCFNEIIDFKNLKNPLEECLYQLISTSVDTDQCELLQTIGIAALCTFAQVNYTGPLISNISTNESIDIKRLNADSDSSIECQSPELLVVALESFELANRICPCFAARWWLLRALFVNQQLLNEPSPQIHHKLRDILKSFRLDCESSDDAIDETPMKLSDNYSTLELPEGELAVRCSLEAALIFLYYGYIEPADKLITKATKLLNIEISFTGLLGKRTRYQAEHLPQLVLQINLNGSQQETVVTKNEIKPRNVLLKDDIRLDEIQFKDAAEHSPLLDSCHVQLLMCSLMLGKKASPSDELSCEEHKAVLSKILSSSSNTSWSLRTSALIFRSKLEKSERRALERAMLQVQAVLDNLTEPDPPVIDRLSDYFISSLPSRRELELFSAEMLISLGCVKSALEICHRLQHWPSVITCYNLLQMRDKAREVIEQELAKSETVELLCLLGDATDDVSCYERAWNLSEEKSARAQRHWANFYYKKQDYASSIKHLQQSLAINSLQPVLWSRLGFAALHESKWEIAVAAYRHACALEPEDSFQAWNNLARCYCELKQPRKAFRALQEALRLEYDNWRVWDNFMLVAAELGEFNDVIRSYHKVLDLKKGKHLDLAVLSALVRGSQTCDGDNEEQFLKIRSNIATLFGRVASLSGNVAEFVKLYADFYESDNSNEGLSKYKQWLSKALSVATLKPSWYLDPKTCEMVLQLSERLIDHCIKVGEGLVGAKLSVNGYLKTISINQPGKYDEFCNKIKEKFN